MSAKLKTIFVQRGDDGEEVRLQYDKKSNLYMNGRELLTKKVISLRCYELCLLTLTTIAVLIQAGVAVFSYIKELRKIFC